MGAWGVFLADLPKFAPLTRMVLGRGGAGIDCSALKWFCPLRGEAGVELPRLHHLCQQKERQKGVEVVAAGPRGWNLCAG